MKNIIKIVVSAPSYVKINKDMFYIDKEKYFEISDEKEIFFHCMPSSSEYLPITYILSDEKKYSENVRITKYKNNNKVIEFLFSNINKVKSFSDNEIKISYYNGYTLNYQSSTIPIVYFDKNYFKFESTKLNNRYTLIKGYYNINESEIFNYTNQKISALIFDKVTQSVIHHDNCTYIKIKDNILKLITLLSDQNKQGIVAEFIFSENSFNKSQFYSVYTEKKPKNLKYNFQIARAFFECITADNVKLLSTYLSDNLSQKINETDLYSMFGKFVKIDNEFLTNTESVNLIIKKDKNFYEAITYNVEFSGGKITNIISE